MNEICSIVVTYNRKELLLRNIRSLLIQTKEHDILIIDNHSTDGTKEFLYDEGILDCSNVHYVDTGKNIGGAGGFSFGLEYAYKLGYQWFMLMDDDGYCMENDVIEKLYAVGEKSEEPIVLNACVVKNTNQELTFQLDHCKDINVIKKKCEDGLYWGDINPFNTTFVPRMVVEKIGFPRKEFFIYGDEFEYLTRIKTNGYKVATVIDAIYYHPVNSKPQIVNIYGSQLEVYDMPIWKNYCSVRNKTYTLRLYGMNNRSTLSWAKKQILEAWYCSGPRLKREYYIILALMDGLRGNFDRQIMFKA